MWIKSLVVYIILMGNWSLEKFCLLLYIIFLLQNLQLPFGQDLPLYSSMYKLDLCILCYPLDNLGSTQWVSYFMLTSKLYHWNLFLLL